MPKLPFSMHPTSWGKKGRARDIAQAEYELTGEELDKKVEEINTAHDKADATEKGEPWVNVVSLDVNPSNITQGFFELDWNEDFIKMLHAAGMTGVSDEDIVNKWFNGVCKSVLLQEEADLDYGLQKNDE